jgi:pyridoxal phosphate enzyme (YggS family)
MICKQIDSIQNELSPYSAKLIAVSKTHPAELIMEAYACGQRDFGENRVQELVEKAEKLPADINWHFIGHLQRNKVKYIAPFVQLIHAVDSWRLLEEINKRAAASDRTINVLLQFKIAEEENKYGIESEEMYHMLDKKDWQALKHIVISGVMGMATFTDDQEQVKTEFQRLHQHFTRLKSTYFSKDDNFKEISMGMSGDYPLALENGSTMVRVGSKIFGSRA